MDNLSSQLGIAQACVTLMPTVDRLRLPQPPNGPAASFRLGTNWAVYAPDASVFRLKATMWW